MQNQKVVFLSTFPPRECGIATFTKDLSDAVQKKFGNNISPSVVAMEERPSDFRVYPKKVVLKVNESRNKDYKVAAEKINLMKSVSVVNIQHEYGIFGGDHGEKLLKFMRGVDKKIVTTFHTVLEGPDEHMVKVTQKIIDLSDAIVVMTQTAKNILLDTYEVEQEKIRVIPHGVPNVDFGNGTYYLKKKFGIQNHKLLVTFGLLSRGKAIEKVIRALPRVVKKHPDILYVVVGETHPKVREEEGESYRLELISLAKKLGVEDRVKFVNKYMSLSEIIDWLKMSDVYLAPSLDPRQICSGTVSYALSAGKAIVASPNKYNNEVLDGGRGVVVKSNSGKSFAKEIISLLENKELSKEYEKSAFEYSRSMIWHNVSHSYRNLFAEVEGNNPDYFSRLPRLNFRHFHRLTDSFGMIQFSDYSSPVKESGYTLDDNARALLVANKVYEKTGSKKMLGAAKIYMDFIEFCQMSDGYFHNFVNENREFLDDRGSEDSFGRTMTVLGTVLSGALPDALKLKAKKIIIKAHEHNSTIFSPRAQAYSIIGLTRANNTINLETDSVNFLVNSLISRFEDNKDGSWHWFEDSLTYGNSVIPEALFEASSFDSGKNAERVARASIDFITKTHFIDGVLVPIGQDGWFEKDKGRALFDQQPIEAAGLTTAYLKAFQSTGNNKYLEKARSSFEWFLGRNMVNQVVYDDSTGGCFDGLTRTGVNLNQGAESTVCYLNARLSIGNIQF